MFEPVGLVLSYILPFLFILPLVVTIHELGHFLAARSFGIAVDRFSIGFGKPLLKWKDRSGVQWQVGWIPLGGYVRFAGDENAASVPDKAALDELRDDIRRREGPGAEMKYFHFKPVWQRAIVVAAGPIANFLLAIALFAVLLGTIGEGRTTPRVAAVEPGSPAAAAGFRPGDLILSANGREINAFEQMQAIVQLRTGLPIEFVVQRDGARVPLQATPRRVERVDPLGNRLAVGAIGLASTTERHRVRYGPVEAVVGGAERTWLVLDTTLFYLGRVITGRESADQLSGPLGIGNQAKKVSDYGAQGASNLGERLLGSAVALLSLAAILSVGLGFMNLLPVPVLDGGHLLFYVYEALARRPLAAPVQAAAYRVGLALLLGLMLFATWNDLQQMRVFQAFGGLFS